MCHRTMLLGDVRVSKSDDRQDTAAQVSALTPHAASVIRSAETETQTDTILFDKAHSSRVATSRIRCFVVVCFHDLGQQLVMEWSPLPCCTRATARTASVRAEGAYGFAMNRVPGGSSPGPGRMR